jgi:amidase
MVPVAFGTQTGGSTIRPASYCGIVGYIPTPGWIGRSGIFPCSWTLDRVGAFGGSVADVALFLEACVAADQGEPATQLRGTQGSAVPLPRGPIGVVEHLVERASPAMRRAVGSVADFLDRAGTPVETVALDDLDTAHAAHFVIMRTEIAAAHSELYDRHASLYGPQIAALVETGRLVTATDYLHALRLRRRYQAKWAQLLDRFEVLLLPGAVGEAEPTLETIGDPEMNLFATFGGLPAITVPAGIGDSGMPVGIQLVAGPSHDAELLRAAAEAEARISFRRPELPEVASFRASGSTRTGT